MWWLKMTNKDQNSEAVGRNEMTTTLEELKQAAVLADKQLREEQSSSEGENGIASITLSTSTVLKMIERIEKQSSLIRQALIALSECSKYEGFRKIQPWDAEKLIRTELEREENGTKTL
jgi:hypothetical protein